jgi:hypothetical protein
MSEQKLVVTQEHFDKTFNVLARALDFIAEVADAEKAFSLEAAALLDTFMNELGLTEQHYD